MSNEQVMNAFSSKGASPGGSKIRIPDYSQAVITVYHAPPGSYDAVVKGFKESVSKAGNKMFVLDIEADIGGGKTLAMRKLHCIIPLPMTANALGKIKQTMLALSVPPDVEIDASLFVGKKCTANIVNGDEYNGKPTSDIISIDPPGQATGPTATVDTAGPAFPVGDDDVPF